MEYLYTPRYCYISPLCFTAQRRLEVHHQRAKCSRIYQEKASGATAERPELMRLLDNARQGDVVMGLHKDSCNNGHSLSKRCHEGVKLSG